MLCCASCLCDVVTMCRMCRVVRMPCVCVCVAVAAAAIVGSLARPPRVTTASRHTDTHSATKTPAFL